MRDERTQQNDFRSTGISPLDIALLPENQARIMMYLLREQNSTDGVAIEMIRAKFAEIEHLTDILDELAAKGWLMAQGDPPNISYKINLRHKPRNRSSQLASLLDTLSDE